jgi:hypothetical protein
MARVTWHRIVSGDTCHVSPGTDGFLELTVGALALAACFDEGRTRSSPATSPAVSFTAPANLQNENIMDFSSRAR